MTSIKSLFSRLCFRIHISLAKYKVVYNGDYTYINVRPFFYLKNEEIAFAGLNNFSFKWKRVRKSVSSRLLFRIRILLSKGRIVYICNGNKYYPIEATCILSLDNFFPKCVRSLGSIFFNQYNALSESKRGITFEEHIDFNKQSGRHREIGGRIRITFTKDHDGKLVVCIFNPLSKYGVLNDEYRYAALKHSMSSRQRFTPWCRSLLILGLKEEEISIFLKSMCEDSRFKHYDILVMDGKISGDPKWRTVTPKLLQDLRHKFV